DQDTGDDPRRKRGPQVLGDAATKAGCRHVDGGNSNSHACSKYLLPLSVTRATPCGRARSNAEFTASHCPSNVRYVPAHTYQIVWSPARFNTSCATASGSAAAL